MNKYIILVLALLCASTLAFRVRQGPKGAGLRSACEYSDDGDLDAFGTCVESYLETDKKLEEDFKKCEPFPADGSEEAAYEVYFTCFFTVYFS